MRGKFKKRVVFLMVFVMILGACASSYAQGLAAETQSAGAMGPGDSGTSQEISENSDEELPPVEGEEIQAGSEDPAESEDPIESREPSEPEDSLESEETVESGGIVESEETIGSGEIVESEESVEPGESVESKVPGNPDEGEGAGKPGIEDPDKAVGGSEKIGPTQLIANVNGVTIEIYADEGVLPEDTELSAHMLSFLEALSYIEAIKESTGEVLEDYMVFDIKLLDREGNEVQPDGSVTVTFSDVYFAADDDIAVYRLEPIVGKGIFGINNRPNGGGFKPGFYPGQSSIKDQFRAKNMWAIKHRNDVVFTTNHFSIYAVGTHKTATYEFYVGTELISTQIVKNGEELEAPEVPAEIGGKKFTGWYIQGESNPLDFDQPVTVSSTATYKVEARYDDVYYVYFKYDGDIITTKEVVPGTATDDTGISLVVTETGKAFSHWSETVNGSAFDFSTAINEDITLHAVLADLWTVTFNTQGGSQVLPRYIVHNGQLGTVDETKRVGYTFGGWYTGPNGTGTQYTSSTPITDDTTLYAKWNPKTVKYTLVYMLENADDNGYTYKESVERTGTAGDTITVSLADRSNSRYTYFSYKEHDTGKTIKGDGSTVVNVYYSRKSYEVEFVLIPSSGTKPNSATLTIGGTTYTHPTKYSFTAKYDSNISALWPTAEHIPNVIEGTGGRQKIYQFYGWTASGISTTYVSKRMNMTSDLFNETGKRVYTGSWSTSLTGYTLHYMIERLPEQAPKQEDRQYGTGSNRRWYQEDESYHQEANATGNWSAKQIKGVTNVGTETVGNKVYFYYTRNSYDLDFYNPTIEAGHGGTFKYGSDISNKNYTPDRPAGVDTSYTFKGWYDNPDGHGLPFDFTGATMPEYNLALYAKWSPPVHCVKYFLTPGEDEAFDTIEGIVHGDKIQRILLEENS